MATAVNNDQRLQRLAHRIRQAHEDCGHHVRLALRAAADAGRWLLEARDLVPWGGWGNWLAANVRFSQRTACVYMRLAEHWEEIERLLASGEDLSIRDALWLVSAALRAEPPPEEALPAPALEADPRDARRPAPRPERPERPERPRPKRVLRLVYTRLPADLALAFHNYVEAKGGRLHRDDCVLEVMRRGLEVEGHWPATEAAGLST
jgi:hypothetical protein